MLRSLRLSLLGSAATLIAAPLAAQASPPASDPDVSPPPVASGTRAKRVYTPADFARFAPKTAYDMLKQVPSFTIRVPDPTERGLGQASENVLINGQRINNKNYTGGVGGAVDQLQRTPAANVDRIEIVDAASLGIAGLSGQVANVDSEGDARRPASSNGIRRSAPIMRSRNFSAACSATRARPARSTIPFPSKNQAGRGAYGGPILIYDLNRNLTETPHRSLSFRI